MLEVGATFDWISPLAGFLGDILNGPSHTFLIPYDASPLSGREIAWMLGKRGVKSWGHMIVGGTFMISVRLGKARWAQHLLEQAGVPIDNPLPAQNRAGRARGKRSGKGAARRRQGSGQRSDVGSIVDTVSEILDTRLF
jgi:hypothetical protein